MRNMVRLNGSSGSLSDHRCTVVQPPSIKTSKEIPSPRSVYTFVLPHLGERIQKNWRASIVNAQVPLTRERTVDQDGKQQGGPAMSDPRMVGSTLDNDLARFDACLGSFKDQADIAFKQANDVQRVGFVHRRIAALVDDVMLGAEACKRRARCTRRRFCRMETS